MATWTIRNVKANIVGICETFNVSETFATVLANRNILDKRKLLTYLYDDEDLFYNPLQMKDMEKAIVKIIECISKGNNICVYGDYDVDGVSSTVILYKALKKLGANVMYYIPDREEEGYGLNTEAIDIVKNKGVDLILTCDNGIASIEEVKYIKNCGMDIIILDHHEPKFIEQDGERFEIIPIADAIVNPKQKDCNYKFKALCAGGISLKFVIALYDYMEIDENFDEYFVFASIATVCDIVDLIDENRLIVKKGISVLNQNKQINRGLFEMLKANNIEEKIIDEYDYGFVIGPCINASGRLESALKSVQLFTAEELQDTSSLATELFNLNKERKDLTFKAVEEITCVVESSSIKDDKILVIYNDKIHESIAGIVAGRIKEIYHRPTFVITKSKDGAKGSGRSIPCYNMFEEMLKCQEIFQKFGGHKMAAGLSLAKENIDLFRDRINENCNLKDDDFIEIISIDRALNFSEITLNLAEELRQMKPLGKENSQPIFATKDVSVESVKFIGKEKNILQFRLKDKSGYTVNSVSFRGYNKFLEILKNKFDYEEIEKVISGIQKNIDLKLDVVYSIEVNMFNNNKNVQLILKDFRIS